MNKQTSTIPMGSALSDYLMRAYPQTAQAIADDTLPKLRGVWMRGALNTDHVVIRAISAGSVTFWTRETWTRGNGWTCRLDMLTKSEFLAAINE